MEHMRTATDRLVTTWYSRLEGSLLPWEIEALEDPAQVADAFSRELSFGTGGIRALMGIGPNRLNTLTVSRAAAGLGSYLLDKCADAHEPKEPTVVMAYDTRHHSRDFALTSALVLSAMGCRTSVFPQPVPTPVLSFATRWLSADAGVVITASHNPREYNGFKVYGPTGCQATDALAHAVQEHIARHDPFDIPVSDYDEAIVSGKLAWIGDAVLGTYLSEVTSALPPNPCDDLAVAYSPLNGTGRVPAGRLLRRLGVKHAVVATQECPDGDFPTCPKPNPEHPETMSSVMDLAIDQGCDIAVANDPDADRVGIAVRHDGAMRLLTGDEFGLLLLDFLCETADLPESPIAVTTIVSSPLLSTIADANGIVLRRTLTGFKYIGEQMDLLVSEGRANSFVCGIEESCGYLRGTYARDKDGMVALGLACKVAAWHKAHGRDLASALDDLYARYGHVLSQQVSLELPVTSGQSELDGRMASLRERPPATLGGLAVKQTLDYKICASMPGDPSQVLPASNVYQLDLVDGSRVIVRPSGTEPKVKAYCFARADRREEAVRTLASLRSDVSSLLA